MSHTLPKTGVVVPDALATVRVRAVGQMATHNGVALNVEVIDGTTVLGRIENGGNGGGSWFYHHEVAAMHWWKRVTDEYAAMPEALALMNAQFAEVGLPPFETVNNAAELLADALVEEAFA